VHNSTVHGTKKVTFAELNEIEVKAAEEIPLNNIMWKPSMVVTKYQAWYYVNVIFLHLIPGLLIDGLIKLSGNKPLYVEIHCIIYIYIYLAEDAVSPSCAYHIFSNKITR
jgi:hypothetical protein